MRESKTMHRSAARHCIVNANSGTVIAGIVAVVPFGNGNVFEKKKPSSLHSGLLHPGLRAPDPSLSTEIVEQNGQRPAKRQHNPTLPC